MIDGNVSVSFGSSLVPDGPCLVTMAVRMEDNNANGLDYTFTLDQARMIIAGLSRAIDEAEQRMNPS